MKTSITLSLAALLLMTASASASSFPDDARKKTVKTQAATANQQVSIKHLRLRMRATILVINQ